MNACLEFHDSVLAEIKEEAGRCVLRFRPAYVHRSVGSPGVDPGDGFQQEIEIVVSGVEKALPRVALPVELAGGALTVGHGRFRNCVPIPLREAKKTVLTIEPATLNVPIQIEGDSVDVRSVGEPIFIERFPGVSK